MSNELEKAIRYFKNMRDDNKVVLDSGFGTKKGENNLPYKNRKKYAELAIDAWNTRNPIENAIERIGNQICQNETNDMEVAYWNNALRTSIRTIKECAE